MEILGDLRIVPLPGLEQLREQWMALGRESGNPFLTWEWATTWWSHFGNGCEQRILGCEDGDGELVAIVPLYVHSRRPARALRQIGHFPADQLGPVCAPERAAAVTAALREHLAEQRDWDLLLWERVPSEAGIAAASDVRQLGSEPMPELAIEAGSWDEFLASKSKNFRGQARNYESRLVRDHGLEFRLCDDPARLGDDLDTLFHLHQQGWEARDQKGAFPPHLASFHRDLAPAALAGGFLRLWLAYLDGEPAAAWYGFRLGAADWYYQGGRDPSRARDSVGFVLMVQTLRDAVESGSRTYKLLLGAEEYKKRFSNQTTSVESVALTRSFRGRIAVSATQAQHRLRERA